MLAALSSAHIESQKLPPMLQPCRIDKTNVYNILLQIKVKKLPEIGHKELSKLPQFQGLELLHNRCRFQI